MKHLITVTLFAIITIFSATTVQAAGNTKGTLTTVGGLGGYVTLQYHFAAGEVVDLSFNADKQLSRAVVEYNHRSELARLKFTKKGSLHFTMPEEGDIVIRFVNERGGKNEIAYELSTANGSIAEDVALEDAPNAANLLQPARQHMAQK